jgi:peptidoglycan/LPS O-acetylase OafA/YrhL
MDFVNYTNYKIELSNPEITFGIIFAVIALLVAITCKRGKNTFFDIETTTSIKGIAILFLIFGHFSVFCLEKKMFFDEGGYWAVIIFLFISGYGLYQKYGLKNIDNNFWKKRLLKLYLPLWLTLPLFIILDHFLIDLHHHVPEIVLNFLGIHFNNVLIRVNAVAWFIEYIIVLYIVYWATTKLHVSDVSKIAILFISCFFISLTIYKTPLKDYHLIWVQYTLVF